MKVFWYILLFLVPSLHLHAQEPLWSCDEILIMVHGGDFIISRVNPSDETGVTELLPLPNYGKVDCIGYRKKDNCIYGIDRNVEGLQRVFRLTPFGEYAILDTIDNFVGRLLAGTVSFDDDHLLLSHGYNIISIDLTDFDSEPTYVPYDPALPPGFADIALNLKNGKLYGFYSDADEFWVVDPSSGIINYSFSLPQNSIGSSAMGFTGNDWLAGMNGALTESFFLDFYHEYSASNEVVQLAPELIDWEDEYVDGCSCQSFDLYLCQTLQTDSLYHCTEATSTIRIVNHSISESWNDLVLTDTFPSSIVIEEIMYNPYVGMVSGLGTNILRIEQFAPPFGIDSIVLRLSIQETVPTGANQVQATLSGIVNSLAHPEGFIRSDYPRTYQYDDDPTPFFVLLGGSQQPVQDLFYLCPDSTLEISPMGDRDPTGFTFQWADGQVTPTRLITSPGVYSLTVSDACESQEVDVIVEEVEISANLAADQLVTIGNSIELSPEVYHDHPINSYSWFLNDSLFVSCLDDCSSLVLSPEQDLLVRVTVMDTVGCVAEDQLQISVDFPFFAPNVFSPNGDGRNDQFYIQSPTNLPFINFQVFDRWGGLRFEQKEGYTNDPSVGWDGSDNSQLAIPGSYIWQATILLETGRRVQLSGDVLLLK